MKFMNSLHACTSRDSTGIARGASGAATPSSKMNALNEKIMILCSRQLLSYLKRTGESIHYCNLFKVHLC